MSKIIFSIYIKIPKESWDITTQGYSGDPLSKSERSFNSYEKYNKELIENKKNYAEKCGSEFILFGHDDEYLNFSSKMREIIPTITEYNIINFYKFDRLEFLSRTFDEILFLDFDVVVNTSTSFFDTHNLSNKFYVASSKIDIKSLSDFNTIQYNLDFRSPAAKMLNSILLCHEYDHYVVNIPPYNTGIMGCSPDTINQLDYFGNFSEIMETMSQITQDTQMPKHLSCGMGWDNESVFGFKSSITKLPMCDLEKGWHFIISGTCQPDNPGNFLHYINKRFDWYFK